MQGWKRFQERAQWNAILWDFPQVWNYFNARNPWKQKRQLTQPPNQPRKWTRTWQNQWQPNINMLLAEKKMEEIERKNARLGTLPGESPVECQVHQVVEPNPPKNWENGEVREPNGYCSQPDEFDSRNHLCSQGFQRCRQYIYQVARCCYQCFHQKTMSK